jgi:GntR family transcriptional regulator
MRVDRFSPLPLHAQVEHLLRALVERPEHRDGRLLPDEVSLAKSLGISRNTVRAGIDKLVKDGLIERRRGVGTRVRSDGPVPRALSSDAFLRELEVPGMSTRVLSHRLEELPVGVEVAAVLGLAPAAKAQRLDRLLGNDQGPLARVRSWLHPRVLLDANTDITRPLCELVQRHGCHPAGSREEYAAVAADAELARALAMKRGQPLMLRRRTLADADGRVLEHGLTHIRGDRFLLRAESRSEIRPS